MVPGAATGPMQFHDELELERSWKGLACGPARPYWGAPRRPYVDEVIKGRALEIVEQRMGGATFAEIAELHGISRERARQVFVNAQRSWELARCSHASRLRTWERLV